jgi:hypothetical protein
MPVARYKLGGKNKERVMIKDTTVTKQYLVASDFDQTLSFNDSGIVLSEVVGVPGFHQKVVGLSKTNLVQQGAELAYLLRHDPEFRGLRREDLIQAGKRVRLKNNVEVFESFGLSLQEWDKTRTDRLTFQQCGIEEDGTRKSI